MACGADAGDPDPTDDSRRRTTPPSSADRCGGNRYCDRSEVGFAELGIDHDLVEHQLVRRPVRAADGSSSSGTANAKPPTVRAIVERQGGTLAACPAAAKPSRAGRRVVESLVDDAANDEVRAHGERERTFGLDVGLINLIALPADACGSAMSTARPTRSRDGRRAIGAGIRERRLPADEMRSARSRARR